MIDFVIQFLKPLKILVMLTLLYAVFALQWKNQIHRYLLEILLVCFFTELINSILIFYSKSIVLSVTLSIILHHSLWLLLLKRFVTFPKTVHILLLCFIAFAIINLFFIEGTDNFNYYTFVVGAFIYLVVFICESFYKLKQENFAFFLSNSYLLLLAPVLFFFGLSFMFAFDSKSITSCIVFADIKLYTIIIFFVNIVYYAFINIFIYREKKMKDV